MNKLTINFAVCLAIFSLLPQWSAEAAFTSLVFFNAYLYYRSLGAACNSDYSRSVVTPIGWQKQEYRVMMEGLCLKCKCSMIFSILFAAASVVAWWLS